MRAAAFVSGGRIPAALRGTRSSVVGHIADWYATICVLAGVSPTDDSPIAPLPVDPANPRKDIYANGAFPGVDGVDLWPALVTSASPDNSSAAHPGGLWLSAEVLVVGDYKLVVAQQDPKKTNSGPTLGWKCGGTKGVRCNTTVSAECGENPDTKGPKTPACDMWVRATAAECKCGCAYEDRSHFVPCLFDVAGDPSEYTDLSAEPSLAGLRERMWAALNLSNLEQNMHRDDQRDNASDPSQRRSPEALVGPCNQQCAAQYWGRYGRTTGGPVCGVPGCEAVEAK